LPMSLGPVKIGPITFSLYWMLFGLTLSVLGLHGFYVGCLARVFFDYRGDATRRWIRIFSYSRSVVVSGLAILVGASLVTPLIYAYLQAGFRFTRNVFPANHLAVTGLLFVVGGFMNFTFTLALHAAAANVKRR
jgi:hypothetical protein